MAYNVYAIIGLEYTEKRKLRLGVTAGNLFRIWHSVIDHMLTRLLFLSAGPQGGVLSVVIRLSICLSHTPLSTIQEILLSNGTEKTPKPLTEQYEVFHTKVFHSWYLALAVVKVCLDRNRVMHFISQFSGI